MPDAAESLPACSGAAGRPAIPLRGRGSVQARSGRTSWEIVTADIPTLMPQLRALLAEAGRQD